MTDDSSVNEGAPALEAVSFDLWGTLIRSHPLFKPARTRMLADAFGIAADATERADALFREADREADREAERTGEDVGFAPRVVAMHGAALADGITTAPVPDPEQLRALEDAQASHAAEYPPLPFTDEVPELLLRLGDAVPLAITSNTGMLGGATMRRGLAAGGLLPAFRVAVFSNEVGASKPAAELFSATARALSAVNGTDIVPSRIAHVGDNKNADVVGARRSGLRPIHVNVAGAPDISAVLRSLIAEAGA